MKNLTRVICVLTAFLLGVYVGMPKVEKRPPSADMAFRVYKCGKVDECEVSFVNGQPKFIYIMDKSYLLKEVR